MDSAGEESEPFLSAGSSASSPGLQTAANDVEEAAAAAAAGPGGGGESPMRPTQAARLPQHHRQDSQRSVSSTGSSRRTATPLPIPPKSPRRYNSGVPIATATVPPLPLGLSSSPTSAAAFDASLRSASASASTSPYPRSPSASLSDAGNTDNEIESLASPPPLPAKDAHIVTVAPASPQPQQPQPPLSDYEWWSSPRREHRRTHSQSSRHRQQRTSIVPMGNTPPATASTSSGAGLSPGARPRTRRTASSTSSLNTVATRASGTSPSASRNSSKYFANAVQDALVADGRAMSPSSSSLRSLPSGSTAISTTTPLAHSPNTSPRTRTRPLPPPSPVDDMYSAGSSRTSARTSPRTSPRVSPSAQMSTQHVYMYPVSPPSLRSRPESAGSRRSDRSATRTSRATSTATFEYDGVALTSGDESGDQMERDFLAAIERRRRASGSPTLSIPRSPVRSTMPLANRSSAHDSASGGSPASRRLSTVPQEESVSPTTPVFANFRASSGRETAAMRDREGEGSDTVYRGSKYASISSSTGSDVNTPEWSLPVTHARPLGSTEAKAMLEEFSSRWSLGSDHLSGDSTDSDAGKQRSPPSPYSNAGARSTLRNDISGAKARRAGRLFSSIDSPDLSALAGDSDAQDDTVTPRGSVANQGTAATYSVYSTEGTMRESYSAGRAQYARECQQRPSAISPLGGLGTSTTPLVLGRHASYTSQISQDSQASSRLINNGDLATPTSGLPGLDTEKDLMQLHSKASQEDFAWIAKDTPMTPEETASLDENSLPPTPSSEHYPGSLSSRSLASDSDSIVSGIDLAAETEQETAALASLSPADKAAHKRVKTIEELVETEKAFALDVAILRDVWMARAQGKELAEIMTMLRNRASTDNDGASEAGDSPSSSTTPHFARLSLSGAQPAVSKVHHLAVAPSMRKQSSQTSNRSLKGFTNPFGGSSSSGTRTPSQGRLSQSVGASSNSTVNKLDVSKSGAGRPSTISLSSSLGRASPTIGKSGSRNTSIGSALMAPMHASDIRTIFINIDQIAGFTETFINVLEEAGNRYDEAGDLQSADTYGAAFLAMLPRIEQVYSVYCSKFDAAIARYESLSDSLATYSSECKELAAGLTTAWDLPSLLIKPVQRCLKYPLFIQQLLGCTPADHPDYSALREVSERIIKVAESINELKRRQEIVGRIVKNRSRSDNHSSTRRTSASHKSGRSVSGESPLPSASSNSLAKSMTKRFRRQSTAKIRTDPPPVNDPAYDVLASAVDARQKAIHDFLMDTKTWTKSVRASLVALLHLSLVWKSVYASLPGESTESDRSSRGIDHFASSVVKSLIEGPWHDLDVEVRTVIAPKISELLDLFRNPRAVMAKRNQKLAECQLPTSVKQDKGGRESAAAYHALNTQLIDELPAFIRGIEAFFSALVGRFVLLQTALQRVMSEKWLAYAAQTCSQLGALGQDSNAITATWYQVHRPIIQQFDSLQILASDKLIADVERSRRDALPPTLRREPSTTSTKSSSSFSVSRKPSLSRHLSEPPKKRSSESLRSTAGATRPFSDAQAPAVPSLPQAVLRKRPSYGSAALAEVQQNRTSVVSASSATSSRSLAYSGRTSSSAASPSTPSLETLPPLWLGASTVRYFGASSAGLKGYPYLACEAGDMFDVLDEVQYEKHALVRKEGDPKIIGWIPVHILQRLD